MRAPGATYSKVSVQRFATAGFVDQDGTVPDDTPTVSWSIGVYAEVGVLPHLQLAASLPWVASHADVGDARFSNRSGGDALLDLTFGGDLTSGLPGALTFRSKWPTYDHARLRSYGAAGGRFPAAGDGQVDLELLGHIGTGLARGDWRGWWMTETGYRHRTEWWVGDSQPNEREVGDGITARVQLGWTPIHKGRNLGWLFVESDAVKALTPSDTTREQLQLSIGAAGMISPSIAAELGVSHLLWTAASAPGTALRLGVSWQRTPPVRGAEDMQPG